MSAQIPDDVFLTFLEAALFEDEQLGLGAAIDPADVAHTAGLDRRVVNGCVERLVAERLGYIHAHETAGFQIDQKRVQFAMRKLQRAGANQQSANKADATYNIHVTNSTIAALSAGTQSGATGTFGNRHEGEEPQASAAAPPTLKSDASVGRAAAMKAADRLTLATFDAIINSDWMANWQESQLTYPQYVRRDVLDTIQAYIFEAEKPENVFYEAEPEAAHSAFVQTMKRYLVVSARERVPDRVTAKTYVISMKQLSEDRWFDDYDERYDKQVNAITDAVESAWKAWGAYVRLAKLLRVKAE